MAAVSPHASVTSSELVRQFGRWQDHAASEPVLVTHHGRDRVVLVSAAHFQHLSDTRQATPSFAAAPVTATAAVEQLMEHVAQGFIAFRKDMTISAINSAACAFLKSSREAVLGHRLDERLPGIEETVGYVNLNRAAAAGSVTTLEMPSFAYDGRWLLFQTFPYQDGAACLFRDITDSIEAQRQADAKAATLAALAAHGGVGRAKLSARGTFSEVDAAFATFLGFAPDGLVRARLTDVLGVASRAAAGDAVEAVLSGEGPRAIDVTLLTRAGVERDARIGLAPLTTHNAPSGAVVIVTPGVAAAA